MDNLNNQPKHFVVHISLGIGYDTLKKERITFELRDDQESGGKILINFRRGMGYYIHGRSLSSYSNDYSYQQKDHSEEEKKFRDALSNQIFDLTGRKPRIDDKFAIFYE
jgi:hypothetical protein